jgi:nucleoside-diphosphate-sugar epimerase
MKAVVLGGRGFLGMHIVSQLARDRETKVVSFDRRPGNPHVPDLQNVSFVRGDILRVSQLMDVLAGADEVYHLAGLLGTSELCTNVPRAVEVNILGTARVLEASRLSDVERVFIASKPNVWKNMYTVTKAAADQLAQHYVRVYGMKVWILRYFNAYGPGQALYPTRKLIPAFAAEAMRGLPLSIFGDGEQIVEMAYAQDLAALTISFLRSSHGNEPMDCAGSARLTVNEVASAVNRYFGNPAGTLHLPMRRGEVPGRGVLADLRPLTAALGDLVFTPWTLSLETTLQWYAALPSREINKALARLGAQKS